MSPRGKAKGSSFEKDVARMFDVWWVYLRVRFGEQPAQVDGMNPVMLLPVTGDSKNKYGFRL